MTSTQVSSAPINDHNAALQKYGTLQKSSSADDPKLLVALESLRILHEQHNFFQFAEFQKPIPKASWFHFIKSNFPERTFETSPEPYLFIGENALSYAFKLNHSSETVSFCWLDEYDYEVDGIQKVKEIPINKNRHPRNLIEITQAANKANMASYIPDANTSGKYIRAKVIEVISSHRSWLEPYAYDIFKDLNVRYYDRNGRYSIYSQRKWHLFGEVDQNQKDILQRIVGLQFIASSENFSKALGNYYSSESLPKKANALDVKCYVPFKEVGKGKIPPIPTNCQSVDLAHPKDILKILQDLQMDELKALGVIFLQENTHQNILERPYQIIFQKIDDTSLVLNMAVVQGMGLAIKTFEIKYRELNQLDLLETLNNIKSTFKKTTDVDKEAENKFLEDLEKANCKLFPLSEHRNWCASVTFYKYTSKDGLNCYLYSLGSESNKILHFVGHKTYEEILTPILARNILNARSLLQKGMTPQEAGDRITYSPSTSQIIANYNHLKYVNLDKKYDEYKQNVLECLKTHPLPLFNFIDSSNCNPYAFCIEYNNCRHEFWAKSNDVFTQCLLDILMSQPLEQAVIDKFCFQIHEFTTALEPKRINIPVFMG